MSQPAPVIAAFSSLKEVDNKKPHISEVNTSFIL